MVAEEKPWIALYVQSFSDSPINWGLSENHYYINSDNSYVIVMNPKRYMICKEMCSNKYYK